MFKKNLSSLLLPTALVLMIVSVCFAQESTIDIAIVNGTEHVSIHTPRVPGPPRPDEPDDYKADGRDLFLLFYNDKCIVRN